MSTIGYHLGGVIRCIRFPETASENPISEYDALWIVASEQSAEIKALHDLLDKYENALRKVFATVKETGVE